MRIACVAFTERALMLARMIRGGLERAGDDVAIACPARLAGNADGVSALVGVSAWARDAWDRADALLFVSACGIATRAIASLVRDKFSDPAVLCVDEAGRFVVPLLSGHVGGANRLARMVAKLCGGTAVISTATDVNGVFAVDEWAAGQGLAILDRDVAKEVSAALLRGESVGFASDFDIEGELPKGLVEDDCAIGVCVSYDADKRPFARTLRLVPRTVVVGVGCKRGTTANAILAHVDACLAQAHVASEAVRALASIEVKANEEGLLEAAERRGWSLRFHSAQELAAVPGEFASSEFVRRTVGVDNVCERAACAEGATLLLGRQPSSGTTVALAEYPVAISFRSPYDLRGMVTESADKTVACVGIGPGGADDMTLRAQRVLASAEVIVGYTTYVNLICDAYPHAEFVTTGMRGEERRCRIALERAAAGRRVAVVCSGDPGVYGMAGLLCELAPEYPGVRVEVVPGVTAANGGAAVLGAPLMHDWCSISLSDLMTPWPTIESRLEAAARADFCIALYNPSSRGRSDHLRKACDVLLRYRSGDTVCGIVRNIGRKGQASTTLALAELRDAHVDMLTCVFVGNDQTRMIDGRMVTPRGYKMTSPLACRSDSPSTGHDDSQGRSVLVFGGTSEGRLLVEWLSARGSCSVVYCATTAYGTSLVAGNRNVTVLQGPLSQQDKERLMSSCDFACIVDATHPYAQHISASIDDLSQAFGMEVVRVARAGSSSADLTHVDAPWTIVADAEEAARHVASTSGNVLLTTGTKDLATFVAAMPDYRQRLYVRILPVGMSLAKVEELGVPASHIVAMQGPFSTGLNRAIIRELGISAMVTKESGPAGGFDQKAEAARECGVQLVVIGRPSAAAGLLLDEAQRLLEERYGL